MLSSLALQSFVLYVFLEGFFRALGCERAFQRDLLLWYPLVAGKF